MPHSACTPPLQGPAVRVMLGARIPVDNGQSGQHHGGFTGESFMASAGLLPGGSGYLALDSYLHGGSGNPSQPSPDGHFPQDDYEEGLEEIPEQEEYEDLSIPMPQLEEPEGEPHLPPLGPAAEPQAGTVGEFVLPPSPHSPCPSPRASSPTILADWRINTFVYNDHRMELGLGAELVTRYHAP